MPNSKSATKRLRSNKKRQLGNSSMKSQLKTLTKKLDKAIESKSKEEALTALGALTRQLDLASQKNSIHKKTASRRKSRLGTRVAKLS